MAEFSVDAAEAVMLAWLDVEDTSRDRAERLRDAVRQSGAAEVIRSLIDLSVAQLAMLMGAGGESPGATLDRIVQTTHRSSATEPDLTVAAAIVKAFWAVKEKDDRKRLARACQVAATYIDDEATGSLAALNAALLPLLGAAYQRTPAEALAMLVRVSELAERTAGKFLFGIRGPRSFAKLWLDGYDAVHNTSLGSQSPPDRPHD